MQALKTFSLSELLAFNEDARIEIIDGEIKPMSPNGVLHQWIGKNLFRLLDDYVRENPTGVLFYDGLICLMLRPGEEAHGLRDSFVPDLCYIRKTAFPKDWNLELPYPYAPTLAVEIMSPGDDADDMLDKVRKYLDAGTEQVWVVFMRRKEIHQYVKDDPDVHTFGIDDTLTDDLLLPGLRLPLSEVFAPLTIE
jgi:Uma2 family endonuclease